MLYASTQASTLPSSPSSCLLQFITTRYFSPRFRPPTPATCQKKIGIHLWDFSSIIIIYHHEGTFDLWLISFQLVFIYGISPLSSSCYKKIDTHLSTRRPRNATHSRAKNRVFGKDDDRHIRLKRSEICRRYIHEVMGRRT